MRWTQSALDTMKMGDGPLVTILGELVQAKFDTRQIVICCWVEIKKEKKTMPFKTIKFEIYK